MSSLIQNSNAKGFTLVEVMIALVVMAVGMLGLASIQAVGMQNNATAYNRTLAMQSAYDMADSIRAAKQFDETIQAAYSTVSAGGTLGSDATLCVQYQDTIPNCSTANMATDDINMWKRQLAKVLPSGTGSVGIIAGDYYQIKVMWDEARTGATGTNCGNDPAVDLKCYVLHVQI
jgi:type IV pilus assembly protein PilV